MDELANFIAFFWISLLEKGRFEMPFKGNSKMDDIANMIRFTQTAEDKKIFSLEQVELIKRRTRIIVEKELLRSRKLYVYTKFTSPTGYLEEMFAGMNIPDGRFPFDMYTSIFPNRMDYEENLDADRCGGEDRKKEIIKNYPGGGVFCKRQSGEHWQIIATLQP